MCRKEKYKVLNKKKIALDKINVRLNTVEEKININRNYQNETQKRNFKMA